MKKIVLILFAVIASVSLFAHGGADFEVSDIRKSMKDGDKLAVLMVHFGTTHADTRALTIDALNAKVQEAFPDAAFREAYTSRIIIKRLAAKGIQKQNPLVALNQLAAEGYTHILIQGSVVIDGVEMESLVRNVNEVKSQFKDIRIGDPLLYKPRDYEKVIEALTKNQNSNTAYVWVGHGTYDSSTAQYAMLDYMFKAKGFSNNIVGTVEGYPEFDDALHQLKTLGLKKVELIPFMFVAGEHAKNDIAGDWKEQLEEAGYNLSVRMEGLGQLPEIQNIFISHLKFISTHRKLDIIEKKAGYEKTGEKADHHHNH
jgi:sirohydrochlorin cobaltochelatase